MASHPSTFDITRGLRLEMLEDLTPRQKKLVAQLLARASEQGYRRGFQQGVVLSEVRPHCLPRDLWAWRRGKSLDYSPWADDPRKERSADRLSCESKGLYHFLNQAGVLGKSLFV